MTYIYHTIKTLAKLEKSHTKRAGDGNELQILELWGENLVTDVKAKKGLAEVSGK